ncbi:MAG: sulfurtransferase-like selenium metabolism protein YedF [Bacteroidales bacterium]|nr:sulfurtransferase-like selenium metabolism protein YedF [Bacteroidales bacterium]
MKIADTTGHSCPVPLIMAKKALKETGEGENLKVITDNKTSLSNLERFFSDNGMDYTVTSEGDLHTLIVKRGGEDIETTQPADYCDVKINTPEAAGDYSVVFSSQQMGEGHEDLGLMLTKSFLITLLASDTLPRSVLLYNSGVKLASHDSFVIDQLRELESRGVKLLLCGTCINFYNITRNIVVGSVSNMFDMAGEMISVRKIIKP